MHAAQRTRVHHAFVLLLFALQLGVVSVVPLVDGAREAASLSRVTHVESDGRTDCAHPHNHVTCQLCRLAGPKFATPSIVAAPLGGRVEGCAAPEWSGAFLAAGPTLLASARAPPLA
jgi:hypothetical protein